MKRTLTLLAAVSAAIAGSVQARDYISIVGSSTVYPFATAVAERFGSSTAFRTPQIESTGSGGGFKLFCAGVGVAHPDITNASRRIKRSEFERCASNGVNEIVEVKLGYDGIVIANSAWSQRLRVTRQDIFLALAREVPDPDDGEQLIANPYTKWHDINPALPRFGIKVLGPPSTSGTREAFAELFLEGGCQAIDRLEAVRTEDRDRYKTICHTVREDGGFVDAGENDNLIVQELYNDSAAVGIFGFSFLDQNPDLVQGAIVDGVEPTFENIADRSYPVSRPLYLYVKMAHIESIPGITEFLSEFTSEAAWGTDGYLAEKGLIPMPDEERKLFAGTVTSLSTMNL